MDMLEAFRMQAVACRLMGSPMYDSLLSRIADDLMSGGVSAVVLAGHEDDTGPSALALRLMGSVHRLVLSRRAPALAAYYPSVGGSFEPDGAWRELRNLLAAQPEAVREWLDRPPQTNEVGRATALYGGVLQLPAPLRKPVRLFEIGSSGGLNLNADRFGYIDARGTGYGRLHSPVRLEPAWSGRDLARWPVAFTTREGSDVAPIDVSTETGRLALSAYVWPDQRARWERLRGGFAVAARRPPKVRRAAAGEYVASIALARGTTTVLWHSVMWQYLRPEEQADVTASIERLGAAATVDSPFARLFLEPWRRAAGADHEFLVVLRTWPGGEERILGTSAGHGVPTTWE
ncbi:MAG: DUF2332 domain-containing protein [Nocardioidaceae bacterium]